MSHEIRTPMTAILGFAEILAEEAEREETSRRQHQAIETIQRNGEHLLEIINEILDLSKIEAGRLEPECLAFSPTALAEGVVGLMRPRADEKGLSLEFEIDGAVPAAVESDPTRIRQILINLVGNALKFTNAGGVQLSVGHPGDPGKPMLTFSVSDTGIGMTAEEAERIFEAFTQGDSTATRRYAGTGLGLTICERLTALLGGNIELESEQGRGSVFRVNLPVKVVDRAQLSTKRAQRPELVEQTRHGHAPLPQLPPGCRVLVAEDGRDNQRLIEDALRLAGAEVEFADEGLMAVRMAIEAEKQQCPFSVVVMDMQMPVLDGYQAAMRLRESGYRRPIIALTAHAMPGDRQKCLEAGCTDYAAKPIDRRRLIQMIGRHARTQTRVSAP
jgi:CheY-like chemotaxis protein